MVKIMIVDDDVHIRMLTKMVLKRNGHDLIEVENGAECLEKLKNKHPDLILMDVMMPGKDGWQICRSIKNNPKTQKIPIVMFTVRTGKADIEKSLMEAGADGHISKPFKIKELESHIANLIKK